MLEGFEIYNMTTGSASISVSENGIGFSKSTVARLEKSPFARVFIDRKTNRIAVQASLNNENGAVPFFNNQKSGAVRWNNKELLKTLAQMMSCDFTKKVYKIDGDYLPDEKAMVFDLNKAVLQSSE